MADGNQQPGWYPSPGGAGERYWDGSTWTEQVRGADPPGATGPDAGAFLKSTPRGLSLVLAGVILFAISSLLPWATAEALDESESFNGWSGDIPWALLGADADELLASDTGTSDLLLLFPIVLVAGGLALALARGNRNQNLATGIIALGALGAVLVIIEWLQITSEFDDLIDFVEQSGLDASAGVGFGLWFGLLGTIAVVVGGVLYRVEMSKSAAGAAGESG
ncbi:MAG: DUF2510 domain-containing protein [Actinomycetota bacterium]